MPRTALFAQHHEVLFGRNWEVRFYAWQPSASHPALDDWQSLTQQEPLEQRRTDAIDFRWQRRAGQDHPGGPLCHRRPRHPAGARRRVRHVRGRQRRRSRVARRSATDRSMEPATRGSMSPGCRSMPRSTRSTSSTLRSVATQNCGCGSAARIDGWHQVRRVGSPSKPTKERPFRADRPPLRATRSPYASTTDGQQKWAILDSNQ